MRLEERNAAVGRVRDQFPVGMRVLAVDDDPVCLKVLENLLRRCQYHVTTTNQAVVALRMLRQNRDLFDLVISDVHMPDMDGFKLLELVGLEMDLPVIMLSVNGETKTVMKGITHGACDYLLKPVRLEELRNIWQHVVRRKFNNCEHANIDGYEECNRPSNADFVLVHSHIAAGTPDQSGRPSKKRKEYHSEEEDEGEESNGQENDDPSAPKKPRVVWSVELHRKFVAAVNQLGIDKAVPKRILELMNVERLTRENVASHLQKYRLYLRRLSVVASQQASFVAALGGNDPFMRMGAFDGLQDCQSFASSAVLPSFSQQGLLNRNNPTPFGIQGMAASRPIHTATDNSTVQLPQKWIHEETHDLSSILSVSGRANNGVPGTLPSITNSHLLQQGLVERRQDKVVIQSSSSASSNRLEATVGVSSSLMDSCACASQQRVVPLSAFSTSAMPMNGSFCSNGVAELGATSSGGTNICPSNDLGVARDNKVGASSYGSVMLLSPDTVPDQKYLNFGCGSNLRLSMDGGNTDNLLNPKLIWSCLPTSQPPNLIGSHHPMSQRSHNRNLGGIMVGQTTGNASTAAQQVMIDMFIAGDTATPKSMSDLSFPKVHSELSSSSCSFDGLLNSIIKVEKDEASFSDDLGCDFYSLGACI